IRYGLQSGGYVKLSVSNLRGQKVVTLVNGPKSVGEYSITWNGRNAYGEEVPTGIYLCSLEVGDKQLSRKLLLIK
ncbi:MAG TPA: FlgD immunoglobulin-like domain containing protein, partial [bacterium]